MLTQLKKIVLKNKTENNKKKLIKMEINDMRNSAVFGLSFHGRQLVRINVVNGNKPRAIVDNDDQINGKTFCGVPIISVKEALREGIFKFYMAGRYSKIQEKQLIDLGVSKSSIFHVPRSQLALKGDQLKIRNDITKSFLESLSIVCKRKNFKVWLDTSGLLAAARNDPIGSLSDFDLLLLSGSGLTLFNELKTLRNDWLVSSNARSISSNENIQISLKSSSLFDEEIEPACIDIRGSALNSYLAKNPDLLKIHFSGSTKFFNNTFFLFPQNYENYLELLYGEDWRTPSDFYRI